MSLESKIELLTAAVVELTRVMRTQTVLVEMPESIQKVVSAAQTEATAPPANEDEAKAQRDAEKEVPNAETKSSPITDISPPSSQASVTYDDVKNVTIAVSKIDKLKAVAGLARFGVTTAKTLNESQWSDYVVYMNRVAAGEVDPEASHE
jgi:hypothetical protein